MAGEGRQARESKKTRGRRWLGGWMHGEWLNLSLGKPVCILLISVFLGLTFYISCFAESTLFNFRKKS